MKRPTTFLLAVFTSFFFGIIHLGCTCSEELTNYIENRPIAQFFVKPQHDFDLDTWASENKVLAQSTIPRIILGKEERSIALRQYKSPVSDIPISGNLLITPLAEQGHKKIKFIEIFAGVASPQSLPVFTKMENIFSGNDVEEKLKEAAFVVWHEEGARNSQEPWALSVRKNDDERAQNRSKLAYGVSAIPAAFQDGQRSEVNALLSRYEKNGSDKSSTKSNIGVYVTGILHSKKGENSPKMAIQAHVSIHNASRKALKTYVNIAVLMNNVPSFGSYSTSDKISQLYRVVREFSISEKDNKVEIAPDDSYFRTYTIDLSDDGWKDLVEETPKTSIALAVWLQKPTSIMLKEEKIDAIINANKSKILNNITSP